MTVHMMLYDDDKYDYDDDEPARSTQPSILCGTVK